MSREERLLEALQEKGIDFNNEDLRHCVHEAAHALDVSLTPPWTNDAVHEAVRQCGVGEALRSECLARAVEKQVLEALGQEWDEANWTFLSAIEFIKSFGASMDPAKWTQGIKAAEEEAKRYAETILALAGPEEVTDERREEEGLGRGA